MLAAAVLDTPMVWLNGAPCTAATYDSFTTLSYTPPPLHGVGINAVVQLAGAFNATGVLSQPFASLTGTLYPAATLALPPTDAASAMLNATLPGSLLCAGGQPRLSAAAIGGVPCDEFACILGDAAGRDCYVGECTTIGLHPLHYCAATPDAACRVSIHHHGPGAMLVVSLAGATDTATVAPSAPQAVLVGGTACVSLTRSPKDPNLYTCPAATVNPRPPSYPVVSVQICNSAGALSTETATVTCRYRYRYRYPATFGVS